MMNQAFTACETISGTATTTGAALAFTNAFIFSNNEVVIKNLGSVAVYVGFGSTAALAIAAATATTGMPVLGGEICSMVKAHDAGFVGIMAVSGSSAMSFTTGNGRYTPAIAGAGGGGGGGGSNASVGTNGTTATTSSTEVAGVNPSGNQQPLQTDAVGNVKVNIATGEYENEEFMDDTGVIFVYRDVGSASSGPNFQAFTVPGGQAYTPGPNPRPLFDNWRLTTTFLPAFPLTVQNATIATGGTGYRVFDSLSVVGGTNNAPAIGIVTQVSNTGAVQQISFAKASSFIGQYSAVPANPASVTGGNGSGATLTLNTISGVAFQLDTTGFSTLQWTGTNVFSQGGVIEGSLDGILWMSVPFLSGPTQGFFSGSANSVNNNVASWVSSALPYLRFRYASVPAAQGSFTYALREPPFSAAIESVSQGPNQGTNNFWWVQQQASVFGPPRYQAAVISTATTNATFITSSNQTVYSIILDNNTATDAYLKIFNKNGTPVPGTDTPVAVYRLRANSTFTLQAEGMGVRYSGGGTSNGLGYAITLNAALNDATAIVAGEIVGTIVYN